MSENSEKKYKEVPEGRYKAVIKKCERGYSKNGRAQLNVWYKIIGGEYDGLMLFQHQSTANETGEKIAKDIEDIARKAGPAPVTVVFKKKVVEREQETGGTAVFTYDNFYVYYDD